MEIVAQIRISVIVNIVDVNLIMDYINNVVQIINVINTVINTKPINAIICNRCC